MKRTFLWYQVCRRTNLTAEASHAQRQGQSGDRYFYYMIVKQELSESVFAQRCSCVNAELGSDTFKSSLDFDALVQRSSRVLKPGPGPWAQ